MKCGLCVDPILKKVSFKHCAACAWSCCPKCEDADEEHFLFR